MERGIKILQGVLLTVALTLGIVGGLSLSACANLSASSGTQTTTTATLPAASPVIQNPFVEQSSLLGSKQSGDLLVRMLTTPNPLVRGENTIEAFVTDAKGQPISDAKVSFDIDMTNMSHGKNVVTASSLGDGHYSAQLHFLMPGPWRVIVGIQRGGQQTSVRFDVMLN